MKRNQDFFRGCLIGGAVGDALGWPVEFLTYNQIVHRFGAGGIQDLVLQLSGKAEITDDTQMTLFTAEGLLRAQTRGIRKGICHSPSTVYYAYQRWLHTQGCPRVAEFDSIYDGWLLGVRDLYAVRAPGNSCLSSLGRKEQGTMDKPINISKGCGGVMRVAPVGLFYEKLGGLHTAAEIAALTHGHPSGYLSAGAHAYIISAIIEGHDLYTAVSNSIPALKVYPRHHETTQILEKALGLSQGNLPDLEAISQLGRGWVGEEALAIAVYCALKYPTDFKQALIAAVNHSGDSDSTGAITGNILGAYLGLSNIPPQWVEHIELKEVLLQMADDLFLGHQEGDEWWDRYPGH